MVTMVSCATGDVLALAIKLRLLAMALGPQLLAFAQLARQRMVNGSCLTNRWLSGWLMIHNQLTSCI